MANPSIATDSLGKSKITRTNKIKPTSRIRLRSEDTPRQTNSDQFGYSVYFAIESGNHPLYFQYGKTRNTWQEPTTGRQG